MKRKLMVVGLLLLSMGTGCTVSDALFGLFGDHYSGGGTTREERQFHYRQQVEASQNYNSNYP
jgi:hypothetical protein